MLRDEEMPPLPQAALTRAVKLVPYEERFFHVAPLAEKMGYRHEITGFHTAEQMGEYGRAVERAAYAAAIKAIDAKTLPGKSAWAEGYRDGLNAGATAVMQLTQEQPK